MKTPQPEPPPVSQAALRRLARKLSPESKWALSKTVRTWAKVKKGGGKVVVATGSGPHIHEGVSVQIAELISKGLVDGVLTSAAVVGHEMAGALERVRRVEGRRLGLSPEMLPVDGNVEVALLGSEDLAELQRDMPLDQDYYRQLLAAPGNEIIKVAGNLAYPTGLWTERMARDLEPQARSLGLPLEAVLGNGCDPRTMAGACSRKKIPILVTTPQLVGGGQVGLALADSISITRRAALVAELLASADMIIESGLALAQEIHDGPLELYTGHGIWSLHEGMKSFSLRDKTVVRIDLDPQIKQVWAMERKKKAVARFINQGLPKAASTGLAVRMEMSGFARLPGSLPLEGDLGVVWPLLSTRLAKALGVKLDYVCYKQGTPLGEKLRQFIVDEVKRMDPVVAAAGSRRKK